MCVKIFKLVVLQEKRYKKKIFFGKKGDLKLLFFSFSKLTKNKKKRGIKLNLELNCIYCMWAATWKICFVCNKNI